MIKAVVGTVFAVLLCLEFVVDASAQQSTTQGLVVGLDVGGASASFDNVLRDGAGLVGGRVGYGFNRFFTLYVGTYEADVDLQGLAEVDRVTLGHTDIGMRFHLANDRRRWVPYADLLITIWPVSDVMKDGEQTTTDFNGAASGFGGGVAIHVSESLALDVSIKKARGLFKDVPVGNVQAEGREHHVHRFLDLGAESTRFTVGVSWWP